MSKTTILAVLDGWGLGKENEGNPVHVADLPTIKYIEENFYGFGLKAGGVSVGLPWGESGSSEVGHLTLGAGRVVEQHFMRITKAIESGEFFNNPVLKKAFNHAIKNNSSVHLAGLLTEGTFNASTKHIIALLEMAKKEGVSKVNLHLFSDGKDSSPRSVQDLLSSLGKEMSDLGVGKISSLTGRYLAMDSEENWEKTERAYNAMFGEGKEQTVEEAANNAYSKNLSDAYIEPTIINKNPIQDNDAIIFFNFREDNMRQITSAFADENFDKFPVKNIRNLLVTTMTRYDKNISSPVAFPMEKIHNSLGEIIAKEGKLQLRIAEQEKWPHVTYFFNGLREEPFSGEYRIMIPSEKVGRPEENPEMQATAITDRVVASLQDGSFNFILLNYANADTVAHTGNFSATIDALKIIDKELNKIVRSVIKSDHTLVITSDHGNAEKLLNPATGTPITGHSPNPVPLYIVGNKFVRDNPGRRKIDITGFLSDVAPTVLDIMNIKKPEEMTGNSLLE